MHEEERLSLIRFLLDNTDPGDRVLYPYLAEEHLLASREMGMEPTEATRQREELLPVPGDNLYDENWKPPWEEDQEEEAIPDTELLPRNTRFEVGDEVLVHINRFSRNLDPQMLRYNNRWMRVKRVRKLSSCGYACRMVEDGGGWSWHWYHFRELRRRPVCIPRPELPPI